MTKATVPRKVIYSLGGGPSTIDPREVRRMVKAAEEQAKFERSLLDIHFSSEEGALRATKFFLLAIKDFFSAPHWDVDFRPPERKIGDTIVQSEDGGFYPIKGEYVPSQKVSAAIENKVTKVFPRNFVGQNLTLVGLVETLYQTFQMLEFCTGHYKKMYPDWKEL
jgi:hypothetical protein